MKTSPTIWNKFIIFEQTVVKRGGGGGGAKIHSTVSNRWAMGKFFMFGNFAERSTE